jgi:flagellar biosynthesis protein FlhG
MKPIPNEDYYELLEISPDATPDQIQRAYDHAKRTFSEDSLATYSLLTPEDRLQMLERIEHAYRILMNDAARRKYDQGIGVKEDRPRAGGLKTPNVAELSHLLTALPEQLTGRDLRNIREHLGISIQEISARTRIHLPYLEFIEDNRYEKLPHEVYLRAYLTQYAQVLGLDATNLVKAYLKNCPKKKED